jgi:ribosomal protein S18 acetylase RimI-like enzyme
MGSSGVGIRLGVQADGDAIATIHVRAWQSAYRGLIPDEFLDGLSVERRLEWWRPALADQAAGRGSQRIWVAKRSRRAVGFVSTGPSRDEEAAPATGEVYAIYVDPDLTGRGIGGTLLTRAVDDLRERDYAAATLWVLGTNARTRRFYEATGWREDGATKTDVLPGFELPEVRYRIELSGSPTAPRPAS